MSEMTVKDFAAKVGRDVPRLLEQMKEAGLEHKSETDAVSEEDKRKLLDYLTKSHGSGGAGARNRITLTRKTKSRIKTGERGKTIEVQVRKKRTYVKREEEAPKAEPVEESGPRQLVGDMADSQARREAEQAEQAKVRAEQAARDEAAREEAAKVEKVAAEPVVAVPELVEVTEETTAEPEPPAPPKEGRTDRRTAPPKKASAKKGAMSAMTMIVATARSVAVVVARRSSAPSVAVDAVAPARAAAASTASRSRRSRSCAKSRSLNRSASPSWPTRCRSRRTRSSRPCSPWARR